MLGFLKPTSERCQRNSGISTERRHIVINADAIMRGFWFLVSVLAINGLTGTSAAPTSEMRSGHTGKPMPTELDGSRDRTYLITPRTWPSENAQLVTSPYVVCGVDRFEGTLICHVISVGCYRVQNVDPNKVPLPTGTRSIETLDASRTGIGAELPAVSGSKWVLVPNMQGKSGSRCWSDHIDWCCPAVHSEFGREYDHRN
jgi:hypothetical protein